MKTVHPAGAAGKPEPTPYEILPERAPLRGDAALLACAYVCLQPDLSCDASVIDDLLDEIERRIGPERLGEAFEYRRAWEREQAKRRALRTASKRRAA